MKFHALLIGAAMLSGVASTHAQVSTDAFSITGYSSGGVVTPGAMPSLLSSSNGTYEFAFGGGFAPFSQHYTSNAYTTAFYQLVNPTYQAFNFQVADGYEITGISVTGIADGYLRVNTPPPSGALYYSAGALANSVSARLTVGSLTDAASLNNITSAQAFDASLDDVSLDGTFQLNFDYRFSLANTASSYYTCAGTNASGGCSGLNYHEVFDRSAGIRWGDMRLTVQTAQIAAPVPEPETYALMLAGLGFTGVWARRRRRAA